MENKRLPRQIPLDNLDTVPTILVKAYNTLSDIIEDNEDTLEKDLLPWVESVRLEKEVKTHKSTLCSIAASLDKIDPTILKDSLGAERAELEKARVELSNKLDYINKRLEEIS